jgi:hypothetical protein
MESENYVTKNLELPGTLYRCSDGITYKGRLLFSMKGVPIITF